jgi:hypothetical protein
MPCFFQIILRGILSTFSWENSQRPTTLLIRIGPPNTPQARVFLVAEAGKAARQNHLIN